MPVTLVELQRSRGGQYLSCGRDLFHVPLHMTEVNDWIQGDVRQSLIHCH